MDVAGILLVIRALVDLIHKNVPQGNVLGRAFPMLVAAAFSVAAVYGLNLHPFPVPTGPYSPIFKNMLDALALWMASMGVDNILKTAQKLGGD